MDGTLGSQTARLLDGSGVEITSREELGRDRARAALAPAGRSRCTRSATSRTARRSTRSRRRATSGRRSGCGRGSSTRSCLAPEDIPRFAELGVAASVQFSHAPVRPRHRRAHLGGHDRPRLRLPVAARRRAPSSRTAPTRRSRSSTRWPGSAPGCCARSTSATAWHPEQAVTVEEALEATIRRAGLARGDERTRGKLLPGLPRRPRRPRPRPARDRAGGATGGRGRRDDGRRPLDAQPAALGLAAASRGCQDGLPCDGGSVAAERAEELFRGLDAQRDVVDAEALVRRVDVALGQVEAGEDRRDRLFSSAAITGSEPPMRISSGRAPITRSNASWPSLIAGSSGRTSAAGALRDQLDLDVGAPRARLRASAAPSPRRSPSRPDRARAGSTRSPRPRPRSRSSGAAARRRRRRARRPPARRTCAGRSPRPRARSAGRAPCAPSTSEPGSRALQLSISSSLGLTIPARSGSGTRPSRGSTAPSTCSSAWLAFSAAPPKTPECRSRLAGPHPNVEVRDPTRRHEERGLARREHVPVEDHARVSPRSSASRKSMIECPPDSSSPSHVNRTFTGSAPSAASSAAAFSRM